MSKGLLYYFDPRNTTVIYNYELMWALKEAGVDVIFLGRNPAWLKNPPFQAHTWLTPLSAQFCEKHPALYRMFWAFLTGTEFFLNFKKLVSLFEGGEVVHFNFFSLPVLEALLLQKIPEDILLTCTVHNLLPHNRRFYHKFVFSKIYSRMKAAFVHTKNTLEKLKKWIRNLEVKLFVPGNFERFFKTHDESTEEEAVSFRKSLGISDERVFLFMGPPDSYKGVQILKKALRKVPGNLKFKIIFKLKKEIFHIKDPRVVTIRSYIPYQKLGLLFRASDVVVLPHTQIDFSTTLFEAAYFQKPVIVSTAGIFPAVVRNEKDGLVFEKGNPDSLAESIQKFCEMNRGSLKKMGANFKEHSLFFNWNVEVMLKTWFGL